jgi:hypothetical protein
VTKAKARLSKCLRLTAVGGGGVDVDVVRPGWLLEVLGVEGGELGVRGRSKCPHIARRGSSTPGHDSSSQRDEASIRRRSISIRGPILKI